jgi:hypothetical protein
VAGYLHFGGGSGWLFGEGAGPGGGGRPGGEGEAPKTAAPSKAVELDTQPTPAVEQRPQADRVRVVVLGGELVKVPAYYRIEGQRQPVDLKGVRDYIEQRLRQPDRIGAVDILIYRNSLYSNSEPVRRLKELIADLRLTPNVVELSGDIPS